MATARQEAARVVYTEMMEEAKHRIEAISFLLRQNASLPTLFIEECVYLQLRLLCELVAAACVVAHGDITATTKLKDEWAADRIIKALERLHPNFYPTPIEVKVVKTDPDGGRHLHIETVKSGFLTRPELIALYRRCGDFLHLGSVNKQLYEPRPKPTAQPLVEHGQKLANLLGHHRIALIDGNVNYVCSLRSADAEGRAQTVILEPRKSPSDDPTEWL